MFEKLWKNIFKKLQTSLNFKQRYDFSPITWLSNLKKENSMNECNFYFDEPCATLNAFNFLQQKLCNTFHDFYNIFFVQQFLHLV